MNIQQYTMKGKSSLTTAAPAAVFVEDGSDVGSSLHEVRILLGWHAGASAPLTRQDALRIGHANDAPASCDLTLIDDTFLRRVVELQLVPKGRGNADPARELHGSADADANEGDRQALAGWRLRVIENDRTQVAEAGESSTADELGHPRTYAFDMPVRIGKVVLTVSRTCHPWPTVLLPDAAADDCASVPWYRNLFDAAAAAAGTPDTDGASDVVQSGLADDAIQAGRRAARFGGEETSETSHGSPDRAGSGNTGSATGIGAAAARDASASHADRSRQESAQGTRQGLRSSVLIIAAVFVIGLLLLALLRVLPGRGTVRPVAVPVDRQTVLNQNLAAVTQVITMLDLPAQSAQLRASPTDDGQVIVTGWLTDDAALDRLSIALSRLSPMPGMQVSVASDALRVARRIADGFGPYVAVAFNVADGGQGVITLRGVVDVPQANGGSLTAIPALEGVAVNAGGGKTGEQLRTLLRMAFAAQITGFMLNDTDLVSREEAHDAARTLLDGAGLRNVTVVWQAKSLDIDASAGADTQRLAGVVEALRERFGQQVPVRATIDGNSVLVASALPFAIVSVTGGVLPSVIVQNGTRLLPGGEYRGFTLRGVNDSVIVFDGPHAVTLRR